MKPDQLPPGYRPTISQLRQALERASRQTTWTHFRHPHGGIVSHGGRRRPRHLVRRETR